MAAITAAVARNAVPGLFIFLVREGMAGLYTSSIHGMYSPFRVPSRRDAGECESRHRATRADTDDEGEGPGLAVGRFSRPVAA
ncbi:hypothetical protein GCM10010415_08220 [Streptomyces atrovirens]